MAAVQSLLEVRWLVVDLDLQPRRGDVSHYFMRHAHVLCSENDPCCQLEIELVFDGAVFQQLVDPVP